MRQTIHKNSIYLIAFLLWVLAGSVVMVSHSRNELFFAINELHTSFLDLFMTVLSLSGRGDTIAIVFVCMLVFPVFRTKKYIASTILFGILLPSINHLSKDFFAKPRPLGEFPADQVHTVPWLDDLYFDSFPSGHTMGAFGFFLLLNHFIPVRKWYLSILFFLLALGCGYSRVYLGQHFFEDIFAGSITGVIVGFLIIYFVNLFTAKNTSDAG